jgi:hypothetical protein
MTFETSTEREGSLLVCSGNAFFDMVLKVILGFGMLGFTNQ